MSKEHPMITGYQWGRDNRYIGSYEFEKNGDQEAVHMPPKTTLIEPPQTQSGQYAQWDEERKRWLLRDEAPATVAQPVSEVPHGD